MKQFIQKIRFIASLCFPLIGYSLETWIPNSIYQKHRTNCTNWRCQQDTPEQVQNISDYNNSIKIVIYSSSFAIIQIVYLNNQIIDF